MGNVVAQLALLLWLPLSLWVGSVLSAQRAAAVILIGAALFLPERVAYDFPVLPPFEKHTLGAVAALAACAVSHSKTAFGKQNSSLARWLTVLGVINVFTTVGTNTDTLRYGPTILPGMSLMDGLNAFSAYLCRLVLPFYLGQTLYRTVDDLKILLRGLVIGGLLYVPLVLFEARMSPQLHTWVYGFFQHDFLQSVRAGGFRAFVFMSHGLSVAFYMSQALTTTVGLARVKDTLLPISNRAANILLAVALVSCKSMGAFLYAGITIPLIWYTKARTQARVGAWLSLLVLSYPLARFFTWIPTVSILEKVATISVDRAQSLGYRFYMEEILLEHALRRPYFGWGSWGRNRVYDSFGRDVSVPDGEWILALGISGLTGFLLTFGLMLVVPTITAKKAVWTGKLSDDDARVLATASLLLAFTGLDMIPNSSSHPLPIVLAGAVASVAAGVLSAPKRADVSSANPARGPVARSAGALTREAT